MKQMRRWGCKDSIILSLPEVIFKIENILHGIKNSLHLMPVVIRPIISSLGEEIEKRSHQFAHAN
jgi:hypothetical protein